MKHSNPPDNLPVVPERRKSEPKDVHFRDPEPGDRLEAPIDALATVKRRLGECSSTIHEATPMEYQNGASVVAGALLTVPEVAAWLQVAPQSVYHLVKRSGLPAYRVGSHLRFRREEVERFLDANRSRHGSATY